MNAHFKSSHVPDFFPSSSAAGSLSVKRAHQSYRHLATKDEVTPPHRTEERVTLTEPRSPCPLHSHRAACREAASRTHQPDVTVRIRSQLALSVPSGGHPLSAGGSYIPHAPTHKNNSRLSTPPAVLLLFLLPTAGFKTPSASRLPARRCDVKKQLRIISREKELIDRRLDAPLRLQERRSEATPHRSARRQAVLPRGKMPPAVVCACVDACVSSSLAAG